MVKLQSPCVIERRSHVSPTSMKKRKLTNACSDQCPYLGTVKELLPFKVVPVPGHGAKIVARAPTKSYVQTSASA